MSAIRTVKEMIRDLIAKAGLSRLHLSIRKLSGQNVDHLFRASLSERFSAIYKNRVWLNGRTAGSLSGLGSDLESTEKVRQSLAELLKSLDTRVLLDVGCGDFTWMKEVPFLLKYVGIDIAPGVIEANNALYHSEQRSFQVLDATLDPLPQADTILCREVLFHLSFQDIKRLVKNIRKCGSSFLIATNDNDLKYNADILSGDFRMLNLCRSPFFFPSPAQSIPDDGVLPHRTLSAWKVADLPDCW
jgi:SAM-dependent methyltransferase